MCYQKFHAVLLGMRQQHTIRVIRQTLMRCIVMVDITVVMRSLNVRDAHLAQMVSKFAKPRWRVIYRLGQLQV